MKAKQGDRVKFFDEGLELEGVINGFNTASGEAYVEVPGTQEGPNQEYEVPVDELEPA